MSEFFDIDKAGLHNLVSITNVIFLPFFIKVAWFGVILYPLKLIVFPFCKSPNNGLLVSLNFFINFRLIFLLSFSIREYARQSIECSNFSVHNSKSLFSKNFPLLISIILIFLKSLIKRLSKEFMNFLVFLGP